MRNRTTGARSRHPIGCEWRRETLTSPKDALFPLSAPVARRRPAVGHLEGTHKPAGRSFFPHHVYAAANDSLHCCDTALKGRKKEGKRARDLCTSARRYNEHLRREKKEEKTMKRKFARLVTRRRGLRERWRGKKTTRALRQLVHFSLFAARPMRATYTFRLFTNECPGLSCLKCSRFQEREGRGRTRKMPFLMA